jgi:ATP-dependent helicase/nuclease subunit A
VAESLRAACRPTYQVWAARRYASAPERERPISRVLAEPADEPRAESGEHGTEWGSVIHLLLQASMRDPRADLSRLAAAALAEVNLEQGLAEEAVAAARSVMGSALWRRALRSRQHFAEVPFQLPAERLPARGEPSPALPGVVRGVIDLVFREPAGWVLVDYKTDDLRRGQLAALVERYAPQVLLYGDAWRHCTGEPVADLGLFFTQHRTYVSVRCR